EAHKRQGRITGVCSHATGSEAHLAAAQEANEAQRLTLIATQLCARMATATDLTRRASDAAAKLSGHSSALAGEIDQWVSTMSSVVSKAQAGKFCLGSSSEATQGSNTLQDALTTALKGKKVSYDNGSQGNTTVPPTACGTPLSETINEEEGQNLAQVKAKLDDEAVTNLLATANMIASASSDPASTCPLTSIAQNDNAGIYREHTVAGTWTITGKSNEHARRRIQGGQTGYHQSARKRTRKRQHQQGERSMENSMHACRHELVHGRGRAGKGEDRSDTAGGKGKSRRAPQKRQRSKQSSNAKGQPKRGTEESSAERRARATDARRRGTRGKHAGS
ncbi:hypothetical protein, conserved in T. vivax, partial [Trypanosoma vivax Y486]